jgi:hypothetical protein
LLVVVRKNVTAGNTRRANLDSSEAEVHQSKHTKGLGERKKRGGESIVKNGGGREEGDK